MISPVDCDTCGGIGFVWIACIRYSTSHWRRKGDPEFAIVTHHERFRCPCDCERGKEWIAARKRGEELPDPEGD